MAGAPVLSFIMSSVRHLYLQPQPSASFFLKSSITAITEEIRVTKEERFGMSSEILRVVEYSERHVRYVLPAVSCTSALYRKVGCIVHGSFFN